MRLTGTCVAAFVLLLPFASAQAADKGAVIRAGDLKAKPFLDAPTVETFAANRPVTILSRQGGWVQVESEGKTGWLRLLNVRMQAEAGADAGKPAPRKGSSPISLLTGSSGKTVTTGVKGLGEEDIKKAKPNPLQVAALGELAVPPAEASANARQSGLKETQLDYLDTPKATAK